METALKILAIFAVILSVLCLALGVACCWMGELLLLFQYSILGAHILIISYAICNMIDTYVIPYENNKDKGDKE